MRNFGFMRKWVRHFSWPAVTLAAVALAALPAMSAQAARPYRGKTYCPPQNCAPQYEDYSYPQPHMAQPSDGSAEGSAGSAGNDVAPPTDDGQGQNQQPQQDMSLQSNNADMNLAPQGDMAAAASGEGSNVGHIGRADNFNRLNIFDSQSAVPANRVWYGMQYIDRFRFTNNPLALGQGYNYQVGYRFGGEVMVTCSSSISFQTQYTDVTSTTPGGGFAIQDSWANPQIMAKQVLYEDCDITMSATMGATIPLGGVDGGEFRETTTRLAPGMLFYSNTTEDVFNYGGFQYNVPLASGPQVDTFDWSFGTGYWLYRSCCCCGTWVERVSVQWEVFGKHVVGDTNQTFLARDPFGIPFPPLLVSENRNVVDMTFGTSLFLCNGMRVALGYSIPVTTVNARRSELIATFGYYF